MNSIIGFGFSSDNGAMCTNFMTVTQPQQLRRWISRIRGTDAPDEKLELPAQPHIFNHYPAPFVRWHQHAGVGSVQALIGVFGLIPNWAKVRKGPYSTMNARAETVAVLPSYHTAWARGQRCIIPAQWIGEPDWSSGHHVPTMVARADNDLMGIAGIWDRWVDKASGEVVHSFSMLTINADDHPLMNRLHRPGVEKRMVVILEESQYRDWLTCPVKEAPGFLKQFPADRLVARAFEG